MEHLGYFPPYHAIVCLLERNDWVGDECVWMTECKTTHWMPRGTSCGHCSANESEINTWWIQWPGMSCQSWHHPSGVPILLRRCAATCSKSWPADASRVVKVCGCLTWMWATSRCLQSMVLWWHLDLWTRWKMGAVSCPSQGGSRVCLQSV